MGKKKKDKKAKTRARKRSTETPAAGSPSTLIQDRRHTKLRTAREAATAAAELAGLDEQFEITNAELRDLDTRRATAERHLRTLQDAIAVARQSRAGIRSDRKQARARAATAREAAATAERKYERAVLSRLLDDSAGPAGGADRSNGAARTDDPTAVWVTGRA